MKWHFICILINLRPINPFPSIPSSSSYSHKYNFGNLFPNFGEERRREGEGRGREIEIEIEREARMNHGFRFYVYFFVLCYGD